MSNEKIDYLFAAIAGFFTGIFVSILLWLWGVGSFSIALSLVLGIPALWIIGIWFGGWLARHVKPAFSQFARFVVVGFLGAAIDFMVLNVVSRLTGITAGIVVGWINVPGFLIAVVNTYLWNKLWVFHHGAHLTSSSAMSFGTHFIRIFRDFPKFLSVTLVGLFLNSAIIVIITTYLSSPWSEVVWLNFAKVIASAVAMIWNFLGYKFFAFHRKPAL